MSENTNKSGGISFVGVLTIVFIVLKLLGKITWKWIWVFSPFWITAALVIIAIILELITDRWEK